MKIKIDRDNVIVSGFKLYTHPNPTYFMFYGDNTTKSDNLTIHEPQKYRELTSGTTTHVHYIAKSVYNFKGNSQIKELDIIFYLVLVDGVAVELVIEDKDFANKMKEQLNAN